MWKRFINYLVCPICRADVELVPIREERVELSSEQYERGRVLGIENDSLDTYVESGAILCRKCKSWYPVMHGLPVMLPYRTPLVQEFANVHHEMLKTNAVGYTHPNEQPAPGEAFVQKTFSKEWLEYEYDGIIWGWSYEDREKTLMAELGLLPGELNGVRYLEIGCGLGITTQFAQRNFGADAVGVDLSLAVIKAANYYRRNPFMHFLQATLFRLPLAKNYFDLLYSHGVLHHTYDTQKAFAAVSEHCKKGGRAYIWLYSQGGLTNTWDRKLGHYTESILRPLISRMPTSVATALLAPIAVGYIIMNTILRLSSPTLQPYNYKRAMHAARDRFTPRYAHRHSYQEVERWFQGSKYANIEKLDWKTVPPAVHALFRGGVGVRGVRIV